MCPRRDLRMRENAGDDCHLSAGTDAAWNCPTCGQENDPKRDGDFDNCFFCNRFRWEKRWNCEACRHANPMDALECELCGRERPEEYER